MSIINWWQKFCILWEAMHENLSNIIIKKKIEVIDIWLKLRKILEICFKEHLSFYFLWLETSHLHFPRVVNQKESEIISHHKLYHCEFHHYQFKVVYFSYIHFCLICPLDIKLYNKRLDIAVVQIYAYTQSQAITSPWMQIILIIYK